MEGRRKINPVITSRWTMEETVAKVLARWTSWTLDGRKSSTENGLS